MKTKAKVIDMQAWKKSKEPPKSEEFLAVPQIVEIFKALGIDLKKILPGVDE